MKHLDVVAAVREGVAGRLRVAIQQTAAIDRLIQPFVRVERQGIGQRQSMELLGRSQGGQPSVGAIDVQPQTLAPGEVGDLRQGIDRAGDDAAGAGHDGDRRVSSFAVGGNSGLERIRPHPECVVDRDQAQIVAADAKHRDGLRNGHVHLFGSIDDAGPRACLVGRELCFSRHCQRHHVRRRTAAAQAARKATAADRFRQPADHGAFDRHSRRG